LNLNIYINVCAVMHVSNYTQLYNNILSCLYFVSVDYSDKEKRKTQVRKVYF